MPWCAFSHEPSLELHRLCSEYVEHALCGDWYENAVT